MPLRHSGRGFKELRAPWFDAAFDEWQAHYTPPSNRACGWQGGLSWVTTATTGLWRGMISVLNIFVTYADHVGMN